MSEISSTFTSRRSISFRLRTPGTLLRVGESPSSDSIELSEDSEYAFSLTRIEAEFLAGILLGFAANGELSDPDPFSEKADTQ